MEEESEEQEELDAAEDEASALHFTQCFSRQNKQVYSTESVDLDKLQRGLSLGQ